MAILKFIIILIMITLRQEGWVIKMFCGMRALRCDRTVLRCGRMVIWCDRKAELLKTCAAEPPPS